MTRKLNILILADQWSDAKLLVDCLAPASLDCKWIWTSTQEEFAIWLVAPVDLVLADEHSLTFPSLEAFKFLQARRQSIPFVVVNGPADPGQRMVLLEQGIAACLPDEALDELPNVVSELMASLPLDTPAGPGAERQPAPPPHDTVNRDVSLTQQIAGLAQVFGRVPDLLAAYRTLYQFVVAFVPCNGLFVALYDPHKKLRTCVYAVSEGEEQDVQTLPPLPLTGNPQSQAILTGQLIINNDYQDTRTPGPFVHLGMDKDPRLPQSSIIVPMHGMDGVIGYFEVQTVEVDAYTDEHAAILQMVANLAANAVENRRLFESERQQRALAEAIVDINATLNGFFDLDEVLDRILVNLDRVVTYDAAHVLLLEGDIVRVVRTRGHRGDQGSRLDNLRIPLNKSQVLQRMATTRCWLVVPDTGDEPDFPAVPETAWVRSFVGAPICLNEIVIGFLTLDNGSPHTFNGEDGQRLQAFAHQAAVAIQSAQMFENSLRHAEELEALRQLTLNMSRQLDLGALLKDLIRNVLELLGTDTGLVYLYRADGDVLELIHRVGLREFPDRMTVRRGEGAAGRVLETGQPLLIQNYAQWEGRLAQFQNYEISLLSAPVRWSEEFLGVITAVQPSHTGHAFTRRDVHLLTLFADQAAVALKNAQLFNDLAAHNESLEQAVAERTAELQHAKEQVESILQNSTDAILLLGSDGMLEMGNSAVPHLFGYSLTEVKRLGLLRLIKPKFAGRFMESLGNVLRDQQSQRLELLAQHKDGSAIDVDVALAPVRVEDEGSIPGIICSFRDITTLKDAERIKDSFVSNVSHELRTPVTNLKLHHQLILRNPQKQSVYLARIGREVERLQKIIEDLLRLSRLTQGRTELRLGELDLNQLVTVYGEDRTLLAAEKGLSLMVVQQPGLPPVYADEGLMGQVLSILLTNAINYTPTGGALTLKTQTSCLDNTHWVGFSVHDTGPGIPPDELPNILDRFYRGTAGRDSGVSGTGLGLSIASEIIEQHEGHFTVESQGIPGQGTIFTVLLPAISPERAIAIGESRSLLGVN